MLFQGVHFSKPHQSLNVMVYLRRAPKFVILNHHGYHVIVVLGHHESFEIVDGFGDD